MIELPEESKHHGSPTSGEKPRKISSDKAGLSQGSESSSPHDSRTAKANTTNASYAEHHERTEDEYLAYKDTLGRGIPLNDDKSQSAKDFGAKERPQTQEYNHLLGDVVPWRKKQLPFGRDLQVEKTPEDKQSSYLSSEERGQFAGQPSDQSDEESDDLSVEEPFEEPANLPDDEPDDEYGDLSEEEDTENTMVWWDQGACDYCEVPPTLVPVHPGMEDDNDKNFPGVSDGNVDLKENAALNIQEKPSQEDCTKSIGAYGIFTKNDLERSLRSDWATYE